MRRIDSHLHFGCMDFLEDLELYRRRGGFDGLCLLSLPIPDRINFNPECLTAKYLDRKKYGNTTWALGSFDLSVRDFSGQVRLLHSLGFDGLKLWEGKPELQAETGISLTDDDYLEGLETARDLSFPVLLHVSDPPGSWAAKPSGCPSFEALADQTEGMLDAVPGLKIIFPHLLFLAGDLGRLESFMIRRRQAFLDVSPGRYFFSELAGRPEEARSFFSRFKDRILFGTDSMFFPRNFSLFPAVSLRENLGRSENLLRFLSGTDEVPNPYPLTRNEYPRVCGLGLPVEVLRPMLYDTFTSLFPDTPAEVDRVLLMEYLKNFPAPDPSAVKRCIELLGGGGGGPGVLPVPLPNSLEGGYEALKLSLLAVKSAGEGRIVRSDEL